MAPLRLALAALLALATSACRAAAPPLVVPQRIDARSDVQSNDAALRVAAAVVRAEDRLARLWPGFWPAGQPFAVYPFEGGTLVVWPRGDGESPGTPVPDARLPEVLRGRAFQRPELAGLPMGFDLDFAVGGRRITAISLMPTWDALHARSYANVSWTGDSVATTLSFLLHESFHTYQLRAFAELPGQASVLADWGAARPDSARLRDARVQRALEEERVWLREAIVSPTQPAARAALRRYAAIRSERLALLPAAFRDYEAAQERVEGIATLVGYDAVVVALGADPRATARLLHTDLAAPWSGVSPHAGAWDRYARWHLYVTGAAKAQLLTRLGTDWRGAVQGGRSLDDLLSPLLAP
jgi:hypothetical protein